MVAIPHAALLGLLAAVAVLVLAWILRANRTLPTRTMHEDGFQVMRLRFYLALAGVLWLVCVPGGLVMYLVFQAVPRLQQSATLPLVATLLVVGLVIPLLIIRSVNLARTFRQ